VIWLANPVVIYFRRYFYNTFYDKRGSMKIHILFSVFTLLIASAAVASELSCQNELRGCFSLDGAKKNNCFYRIAENSDCQKTEVGQLAGKRWGVTENTGETEAHSLLGPSSVDKSCLESCDNQWLAFIVAEESPASTSKHISACLDSCSSTHQELIIP
jgi:hypothetical protein